MEKNKTILKILRSFVKGIGREFKLKASQKYVEHLLKNRDSIDLDLGGGT